MPTEYQYAAVPDKLKEFIEKLRSIGIPEKATLKWLESLGYKSTNDRSLLRVLGFIGFFDSSGIPLDYWKKYRGANSKQVLAEAIIQGYQELFSVYPDAYRRDDAALEDFFSTKTKGGKQVISRLVRTFKSLSDLADFSSVQYTPTQNSINTEVNIPSKSSIDDSSNSSDQIEIPTSRRITPHITFNIQVVLPENATPETYNNIFKSIADHLLK